MTLHEMIDQMEINVGTGAQSVNDLYSFHKQIEARADQAVCQDLTDISTTLKEIQSCKNGVCALNWKPTRQ